MLAMKNKRWRFTDSDKEFNDDFLQPNKYLEAKFTSIDLGYEDDEYGSEDKEIYVDFILKSNSIIRHFNMANYQCKKLDPLVTGDIGSFCVDCLQDTNFLDAEGNQTFRFVNRIPC